MPFLWLETRYIAINHFTKLILVFSKIVLTNTEKFFCISDNGTSRQHACSNGDVCSKDR